MKKIIGVSIAIFTLVSLIVITEYISYIMLHCCVSRMEDYVKEPGDQVTNAYNTVVDPILGWRLPFNSDYQASIKKGDGRIIYDVNYKIDSDGRRQIEENSNRDEHFLIFGDSLSYGTGLNDNETIQYLLSQASSKYQIYNYSVPGYGANQVLMQLRDPNLANQIKQKNGIAMYFFNPDHIHRALGSSVTSWNFTGPSITLKTNELKFEGSMLEAHPWRSKFLNFYTMLRNKSNFLTLIGLDFPIYYNQEEIKLVAEMISEASQQYKSKFKGEFFVVFHPLYKLLLKDTEYLKKLLEAKNIKVFSYEIKDSKDFYIPGEGHPSAIFNRHFTPMLIDSLNKEGINLRPDLNINVAQ